MAREIEGRHHLALWFGWLVGWLPKVLCSGHRDWETSKDSPLTSHFIVSVVQGPELVKLHSLTELCSLRVSVETYITPKGPLQWKHCQCFGLTQRNCSYASWCVACGDSPQKSARPHNSSLSAAALEETTQPTTRAV